MFPEQLQPGLWRGGDTLVNWYLVADPEGVTVIDAGMPGHWTQLTGLLSTLGDPPVRGLLLTHGHADHIGFAERARRELDAPVFALEAERKLMEKPLTGSSTERQPLAYFGNASARAGLVTMLRGGLLRTKRVERWTPLADRQRLDDLPGRPQAVATPGHTAGHVAFVLEEHDAVVTGDALVTWDPYTDRRGPRLPARGSMNDSAAGRRSLERLAGLEGTLVLPGHGEVSDAGIAAAAREALEQPQG